MVSCGWLLLQCALLVLSGTHGAPPNIVFILSESLDGRLLREGSAARIPNIRALLSAGSVRFDTAYSNNPVCAPSRSSLWSGRAPHRIPHMHNGYHVAGAWNNWEGLPANYDLRMDQLLQASQGYNVSLAGKTDWTVGGHTLTSTLTSLTFNVPWPYNITATGGWNEEDTMCATRGSIAAGGGKAGKQSMYPADWNIVRDTADFIASSKEPFFAYAGTGILHPPYATNEFWYAAATANVSVPPWQPLENIHPCDLQAAMKRGCTPGQDNASAYQDFYSPERIQRVRRVYLAELEEFDDMVGEIVSALHSAGRAANTYIVLAADHGDMQLEHQLFYKMMAYDASARVPLVFASPILAPLGARVVDQPVQLLDLFPTILRLAGVAVPSFADGYDLTPFLTGTQRDVSRPPFVTFQNHDEDISMSWFAVTDGEYKLVQYGTGGEVAPQLFNLSADPHELTNVFNTSPAYTTLATTLDTQLRQEIDYPAVALDVARYQLQQFRWWAANGTSNWRRDIASARVRWEASWARYPDAALRAVTHWMQNDTVSIRACDGRLATAKLTSH